MKVGRAVALAAVCLLSTACFHQVVQTGRPAGTTVIHKPWTPFFVFGLVGSSPIDVTTQCPSGIATVETQQTFMNGVVSFIALFGLLYSPRDVKITCAGRAALNDGLKEFHVAKGASAAERNAVFSAAAQESQRTNQPTVVSF